MKNHTQCDWTWLKRENVGEKPYTMCLDVAEAAECRRKIIHNVLAWLKQQHVGERPHTFGRLNLTTLGTEEWLLVKVVKDFVKDMSAEIGLKKFY